VTATMREVVHNVVRNSFPEGVGPIKRLALGGAPWCSVVLGGGSAE